jgi:hypothetical protein
MPSFDFKKDLLPHVIVVAALAILAIFYSLPALEGKVLYQHDTLSWKAAAHEGMSWHEETGESVSWSNSMFGGMPTYTQYYSDSKNFVYQIQGLIISVFPKPAYFFFIAMLSFYILMHVLRVNRWLGLIGAVAYAFASYNPQIIAAGHETKMMSVGYMPAVIAGLFVIYRGKYLQGAALTGVALALVVTNSHWQMVYYLMIMIVFMGIGMLIVAVKEGKLKQFFIASAIAIVTSALAVGPQAQALLSTAEYTKHTMRGGKSELSSGHDSGKKQGGLDKDYAFTWSLGLGETFSMMIPDLYGGSSEGVGAESKTYETVSSLPVPGANPQQLDQFAQQVSGSISKYWGPQRFLSGPVYFGAAICFLFVLGLFVIRSPHKWWMVAISALAIAMAWGKHLPGFNYFLFDNLPGLNKFRTPTIMLTIPQLLFPVIAVWALNDIIKEKLSREDLWKKTKISLIITGGLCLLFAVAGSALFSYKSQYVANPATGTTSDDMVRQQISQAIQDPGVINQIFDAVREDRASLATTSAWWSLFYILLAGAALWAFAKKKIKGLHLIIAIGIIVAVDILPQSTRYLGEENYIDESDYEAIFSPRPVDQQILQDKDPYYRVLDLSGDTYNDAMPAYHHKLIGGYSPAKMEIYQDLIDNQMNRAAGKFNGQVLNMLNTKYLIVPMQGGQLVPQRNPNALGNAWFVNEIKWVNTADEEMKSLDAPNLGDTAVNGSFNAATTAIVRNTFKDKLAGFQPAKDSAASIKLTKYGLNNLSFKSKNSREGFAVFSDIYYPDGWKAYIDGKETPIIRTNYVLRGLRVPAGEHSIEFKFDPESFRKGGMIAAVSSILIYILLIAGLVAAFRSKSGDDNDDIGEAKEDNVSIHKAKS